MKTAKKRDRPDWQAFKDLLYLKMRPDDVELVMEAYGDAKTGHGYEQQVRDNGERYFEHPRRVALILMRELGIYDPDMIISALLHDIVEDTYSFGARDEAYAKIQRRYNKRVATFVLALSKEPCQDPEEKIARDHRYFEGITSEGPKTMILKLADRLDNLRDLDQCTVEKKRHYAQETRAHILPMAMVVADQVRGKVRLNVLRVYGKMVSICQKIEAEIGS